MSLILHQYKVPDISDWGGDKGWQCLCVTPIDTNWGKWKELYREPCKCLCQCVTPIDTNWGEWKELCREPCKCLSQKRISYLISSSAGLFNKKKTYIYQNEKNCPGNLAKEIASAFDAAKTKMRISHEVSETMKFRLWDCEQREFQTVTSPKLNQMQLLDRIKLKKD